MPAWSRNAWAKRLGDKTASAAIAFSVHPRGDRCGNALMTSRTRRVEADSGRGEVGAVDSASTSGSIGSDPSPGDIQSARS